MRRRRIAGVGLGALLAFATVLVPAVAQAATTTTILYSTDNGATWSANPTIAAGATVLTRIWYDNTDATSYQNVSITSSLPAGFTLVPGSTTTCLNPSTTAPTTPSGGELVCNTSSGQGGAITESAVWSGSNLAIGPLDGIYGQATNLTSSTMAMGQTRYFNLSQCVYGLDGSNPANENPTDATGPITFVLPAQSGTNVANAGGASRTCTGNSAGFTYVPAQSTNRAMDLLGQRYVDMQECMYQTNAGVVGPLAGDFMTETTGVNTASSNSPTVATCPPTSGGYTYQAWNSTPTRALDVLNNRYINLYDCFYKFSNPPLTGAVNTAMDSDVLAGTSTTASNTPATAACPPSTSGFTLDTVNSGVANLDTYDATRGMGYVQYSMVAPSPTTATTFPQADSISGLPAATTGSGSLTVAPTVGTPMITPLVGGLTAGGVASLAGVLWFRRRRSIS